MTHIHIAIFRWKKGADKKAIADALRQIQGLAKLVPGIIEIAVGHNESKHAAGYTHVVFVRGETLKAINAYREHPLHAKAAQVIEMYEEQSVGVDFVTGEFI
jgi:heme-degrading monooxygenase HmoA